jgi:glutamate N-acetyltransferase/amino-acid N-acetyltransferase
MSPPKTTSPARRKMAAKIAKAVPAVSPLAPVQFPVLPPVAGMRLGVAAAGIRNEVSHDVLLVELAAGTQVAGALTRSKTRSAPVDWCARGLRSGKARALVANAGNANAFTGRAGKDAVRRTAAAAAAVVGGTPSQAFIASTGVIGQPLPTERIEKAVAKAAKSLASGGWRAAADAIRTTDTYPKGAMRAAVIGDATVTLCGIAKGSGMIAPDLGTMFAFVFTDAKISAAVLQPLVTSGVAQSFNAITVDSDTSTSDTVLVFSTGKGPMHSPIVSAADPALRPFRRALHDLMRDLAQQIVRDGEGASKFITVRVEGARSARAARRIALSIANSPLVKTAVAGEDPNWGRVVAAVGKAGEEADRDKLAISFGPFSVAENGGVRPGYVEAPVAAYMKGREIEIAVDVGVGPGRFTVWTCDLGHDYIRINADYRS